MAKSGLLRSSAPLFDCPLSLGEGNSTTPTPYLEALCFLPNKPPFPILGIDRTFTLGKTVR